jgi:hypothetical protein
MIDFVFPLFSTDFGDGSPSRPGLPGNAVVPSGRSIQEISCGGSSSDRDVLFSSSVFRLFVPSVRPPTLLGRSDRRDVTGTSTYLGTCLALLRQW